MSQHGVDDAEQRQAEAETLMLRELQHRVRNILAMVRSIIRRSAAGAETPEELGAVLEGRIDALARTQSLLTREVGAGANLELLVLEELLAHATDMDKVALKGPEVVLPSRAAEIMTLAIHELVSNATTHGAIGQNGSIDIAWTVTRRPGQADWLELSWIEHGVKVMTASPRRGFGFELIEDRIPYELSGEGELTLRPGGVTAKIGFPLIPGQSALVVKAPCPSGRREG